LVTHNARDEGQVVQRTIGNDGAKGAGHGFRFRFPHMLWVLPSGKANQVAGPLSSSRFTTLMPSYADPKSFILET
jgi:hypothetical protein